jgi:hypothetical protein
MIKISDTFFQIELAEIWEDPADENGGCRLSVAGESKRIDGESWEPRFYWEGLPLPVSNLASLTIETLEWDAERISSMEAPPTLFVFEHLTLSSGRLCLKRLNENFVSLSLEGTCDVFFGKYQSGLPIGVEAELKVVSYQDRYSP